MSLLILSSLLTFVFYYLACFEYTTSKKKLLLIICFLVCSFFLRAVIDPALNNDFDLYYNFKIFHKPTGFFSYLLKEPYLYYVYSFFKLFFNDKATVFCCLYWFNSTLTTVFFIWLAQLKDIDVWKKMLIFSIFYFFFGFVLLRNNPVYLLFALYFYYSYRNLKFDYVLLTPLMHITSILMLIVYFHKWKRYYLFFIIVCILAPILLLTFKSYLQNIDAFNYLFLRIDGYFKTNVTGGFMHWLFFAFISGFILLGIILYKKRIFHPFLVTTAFFYYISFFISPIMAFRFTPYVLFALLFLNYDVLKKQINRILNLSSVFLFVIYLFILYHTHNKLIPT